MSPSSCHLTKAVLVAATLALAACGQSSEAPKADAAAPVDSAAAEVIKARQARYKELGASFKAINEELKKGAPDVAVIQANAPKVVAASKDQFGWFPAGSGPEAGVKTEAKAEIWSDAAGFATAQKDFEAAAAALGEAAAGGDLAAIGAQVKAVGATCGGCHDKFRTD
jgi:cytochrome c556